MLRVEQTDGSKLRASKYKQVISCKEQPSEMPNYKELYYIIKSVSDGEMSFYIL